MKYCISKDKNYYRAFPDLLLDKNLICIFSEMNEETKEYNYARKKC